MIIPLIHRHAQDAAWLYSQIEADRASAVVDLDRLRHFQRLFAAHLDGLLAAGETGRQLAREQLEQWRGPGEFFVWAFLELHARASAPEAILDLPGLQPETRPGVNHAEALAWALVWLPPELARPCVAAGLQDGRPRPLALALDVLGLWRQPGFDLTEAVWEHHDPGLRAAACRYAGRLRLREHRRRLETAGDDSQAVVRREAAVALLLCGEFGLAWPALYAAVRECAAEAADGEEGGALLAAERRAQHLARLLGPALPRPCPGELLDQLAGTLPEYLHLLVLAHHGDPACVPRLWPHMDEGRPYAARALRALTLMSGLNADDEGLCRDPAEDEAANRPEPFGLPGLDMDAGLPRPDRARVERWWAAHQDQYPGAEAPLVGGHGLYDPENFARLLEEGDRMQDQRLAASLHLLRLGEGLPWLDTRLPWAVQKASCAAIRRYLADTPSS